VKRSVLFSSPFNSKQRKNKFLLPPSPHTFGSNIMDLREFYEMLEAGQMT
jgi:hypothetical protein